MGELPLQRDRVGPHFEAGPIVTQTLSRWSAQAHQGGPAGAKHGVSLDASSSARNVQDPAMLRHSVAAQAKKPVPAFTKVPSQGRRPSSEAGRDHHFDVCEEARRTWWTPWRHGSEAAHGRRRYVRAEREARQRWRAGRQRRWPQASASWRSGGFSQRQIMPEAAFSSGQPRSASQPVWPCLPATSGLLSTQAR